MIKNSLLALVALACTLLLPLEFVPLSSPNASTLTAESIASVSVSGYQDMMLAISHALSGNDDVFPVMAWQDHHGNLQFTDTGHTSIFPARVYEVRNHHDGRLAFTLRETFVCIGLTWVAIFSSLLLLQRFVPIKSTVHGNRHHAVPDIRHEQQSPYRILEISPQASADEIRKAYRRKMQSYHPDRFANLDPDFHALATRKAQEINNAYEFLAAV